MIFAEENAQYLKPWLVRTLEPICDAEPGALADYVLALLKHNGPESDLRKEMEAQLDEFLEKECSSFLDTLFTALRTKSYLPYVSSPSTSQKPIDTGIPIPLDGLLSPSNPSSPHRGRKRSLESDDREGRSMAKGARLASDAQFSRYGNGRGGGSAIDTWTGRERTQTYRDGYTGTGSGKTNGRRPPAYLPPDQKRGICRDYHNTGFCARGEYCKYSHGEDALTPGQLFPMNGMMPVLPMFANGYMNAPAAYDPHEAQMDMRPVSNGRSNMRPPVLPRMQRDDGSRVVHSVHASGELPVIQDLTPNVPPNAVTPNPLPQRPIPPQPLNPSEGSLLHNGSQFVPPAYNGDIEMSGPMDFARPMRQYRPGFEQRNMERGPGIFNSEAPNFRPERRRDKTLVMEKIPEDKLSLEHVNDWFKRFGTVTNVAIDRATSKALITFSSHEEAHAAWKSEDAVFNNRFVKLFWHRPMEGHGQVGTRMLAASAPIVANLATKDNLASPAVPTTPAPRKLALSSEAAALAAKQQKLEQQITEQKTLMESLGTATPTEKKEIMARLRKLGEEMTSTSTSSSTPTTKPKAPVDREKKALERLDKELDLHNAVVEGEDESPEALKAKLELLKAEAASLGISDTPEPTQGYRPYRGRGRGGRGHRGAVRGAPPRQSMKLDNRPKKLHIKGVNTEGLQALQDWYETTGQVESFTTTENGEVVVAFRTRAAAEQGLAKGQNVPTVGPVQVSWYTGAQPKPKMIPTSDAPSLSANVALQSPRPEPEITSTLIEEEEVAATGWGGDGEDGM
ncbi:hypothetical protein C8J56DRAFT_919638 [Mycena floridula]|nr:hypothetical protein C8J56DRAFT_919638 [Mycena floridula]